MPPGKTMEDTLRAPDLESEKKPDASVRSAENMARRGAMMLVEEWRNGFPEAAHCMSFPRSQGFTGPDEDHRGDLFHRALALDALADFRERYNNLFPEVFQTEIEYILRQRRTTGIGGWAYFPKLRELPSDADDLAQVMQVFLRNNRKDAVHDYCTGPLAILLQDNLYPDGSFETWIIPREFDGELALQEHWARIAWGTGPDCEVIANLLYALWLYDSSSYQRVIERGAAFLASKQEPDGSWTSTWYHGPFYGTWACLRLFGKLDGPLAEHALTRGEEFLVRQQRPDGGWGYQGFSDPMSTSFALLGLRAAAAKTFRKKERGDCGMAWLSRAQQPDGGWTACPFIRMQLGRPSGTPWMTLSYGSRTISTTFAIKAALAWDRQEGQHDNSSS